MMQSEEAKLDELLEEVLTQHRCKDCKQYFCCQGGFFHDVNCWSTDLRAFVTWRMIYDVYKYRLDVYNGCMHQWEGYAFETFDPEKHTKFSENFVPHL